MSESPVTNLPEWARAALADAVKSTPAPSIRDQRSGIAWPLFVDAATVATFLPRELAPGVPHSSERKDAERAVLRHSELSKEPGGARWTLTREARRQVLSACDPAEIVTAFKPKALHPDPVTGAMRDLVLGKRPSDLRSLDVQTLEAMRLAAAWLTGVSTVAVPGVGELDRVIELRRLLAPFERMTGKREHVTFPGAGTDRFFGRDAEIERLRASVGVVAADRLGQRVQRVLGAAMGLFTGHGHKPLNVYGTGGVGKTTLVAKFMLEHAQVAASRFPFAYLDFDRPTISASNRAGLLAEICRQVGAQFPEISGPLSSLCERVALAERTMPPGADYISILIPFATELRRTVDRHFDEAEPFLLVFDTFEVVQYGRDQVAALEELVRAFFDGQEDWPRLRLIISGRVRVDRFLGDLDYLELGALDLEGSTQMLEASAAEAGKPINRREAERLVRALAKALHDPTNDGVRPLRLRLISDLFVRDKASGPAIVESLLDELAKPNAEQDKLGALLVDGILVRRILGHVNDPRVRALADPGLVVRRVTKDVIKEVMTRGTSKDALQQTTPLDPDPIEPWTVDDTEAANIFAAFALEITLVEAEGDALRHRQDVRRDMLPLIEVCRPHGFGRIHRLAYEFFRRRAAEDSRDDRARAEAVYHGLWLREPLDRLDTLWPRKLDPAIDSDEFPSGSPANVYLRARRHGPLAVEEVRMLPPAIRLRWWSGRTDELLEMVRVLPEVPVLRAVAGEDFQAFAGRPDLAAVGTRILFRAGVWRESSRLLQRLVNRQSPVGDHQAEVSLLRTYATIAAKSQTPEDPDCWLVDLAERIEDPLVRTEVLAHAALSLPRELVLGRLGLEFTDSVARVPQVQWRRQPRILRLALATGLEVPRVLLETFVGVTKSLPRDVTVARLLTSLLGRRVSLNQIDETWRSESHSFLGGGPPELEVGLRALAAADHSDWYVPFGNAITRSLEDLEKPILRAVREVVEDKRSYSEIVRGAHERDGHSFLHLLVGVGALMPFAEALAAPQEMARCPETAPEFASALVRWHRRIAPEDPGASEMP